MSSALARAARRLRRSSRWAALIDACGLPGFVCASPFFRLTPVGALLKLIAGFFPADCVSVPPGHAAIASCACFETQASDACAGLAVAAAPATSATAAAALRSDESMLPFESLI